MRVYLYPYKDPKNNELLTSENLKVNDNLKNCINILNITEEL